jgi:DNA polymerase III epsilon subunit-like protein
MNSSNIIVFDFETGGLNPKKCSPIQVAAVVLNPRTLEVIPNGKFNQMMCPLTQEEFDAIEDGALAVNKKTREQIKAAPPEDLVWKDFGKFVLSYKNGNNLPIPAGQFIYGYDLIISERLCKKYGPWDKKRDEQALWSRDFIDLKNDLFRWFENSNELPNMKLDTVRDYFGMRKDQAHDAMEDVRQTAEILVKFMKLYRSLAKRVRFKDSLLGL